MAAIDSKKLLPSSGNSKQVFLVPSRSIVPLSSGQKKLKPSADTSAPSAQFGSIILRVNNITEAFKSNLAIQKVSNETKRRQREQEEFKDREKQLETNKLGKKGNQESQIVKIPGASIFERLKRFVGFTILGFIFNNYANLLPRLTSFVGILKPAAVGIGYFTEGVLSGTIDWIEKGYKAYDFVKDTVKKIGGDNYAQKFDELSGVLNQFLNAAAILGLAGISGGLITPKSIGIKPSGLGAGLSGAQRKRLFERAKIEAASRERSRRTTERRAASLRGSLQARKDIRLAQLQEAEQLSLDKARRKRALLPRSESVLYPYKTRGERIRTPKSLTDYLFGGKEFGYEKKASTRPTPQTYSVDPTKIKYSSTFPSGYVDFRLKGRVKRMNPSVAMYLESVVAAEGVNSKAAAEIFNNPRRYAGSARRFMGVGIDFESRMTTRRTQPKIAPKPKPSLKVKGFGRNIPIVGPIIDFAISLISGDPIGEAGAAAVGSAVGSGIVAAVIGSGTFGLGAALGLAIGGFIGDLIGRGLYRAVQGFAKFKDVNIYGKTSGFAQGGQVGNKKGVSRVSRSIKKPEKVPSSIRPQRTQPGKDVGGRKKITKLYPEVALNVLMDTSQNLKSVSVLNGALGSLMGASVDLSMGQKFDSNLAKQIGDQFGYTIQGMVDSQISSSIGNISTQVGMANGGIVPSRNIRRNESVGTRIGRMFSANLSAMLSTASSKVLGDIRSAIGGGAPTSPAPTLPSGKGGGLVSVSSDSPDFWLLTVASLLENSNLQGAADVAQVIYNRVASPAWPNSIRDVIMQGNGGQFQAVRDYGTISAWKSIVDKKSAIDFIQSYGKGTSQSQLELVAASLLDPTRQRSASTFVGPRDSFRSIPFEDQYNHLADDTEQRRHGHVFGFEPGGAQIGSFKAGKLSAAQISQSTRGKVTQLSRSGLPLTGENGRLKPSQLTKVGTLAMAPDYNDWYGNGAYLRHDAAKAFLDAKAQAEKEGITIQINSAYRSLAHQQALQGKYAVVAEPGTSRHGEGTALDLEPGTPGYNWFIKNGPNFGWRYMAINNDPYHFEYVGGYKPAAKIVKKQPRNIKLSKRLRRKTTYETAQVVQTIGVFQKHTEIIEVG